MARPALENLLMTQLGLTYGAARKLVLEGRTKLGMGKFTEWTDELADECRRIHGDGGGTGESRKETTNSESATDTPIVTATQTPSTKEEEKTVEKSEEEARKEKDAEKPKDEEPKKEGEEAPAEETSEVEHKEVPEVKDTTAIPAPLVAEENEPIEIKKDTPHADEEPSDSNVDEKKVQQDVDVETEIDTKAIDNKEPENSDDKPQNIDEDEKDDEVQGRTIDRSNNKEETPPDSEEVKEEAASNDKPETFPDETNAEQIKRDPDGKREEVVEEEVIEEDISEAEYEEEVVSENEYDEEVVEEEFEEHMDEIKEEEEGEQEVTDEVKANIVHEANDEVKENAVAATEVAPHTTNEPGQEIQNQSIKDKTVPDTSDGAVLASKGESVNVKQASEEMINIQEDPGIITESSTEATPILTGEEPSPCSDKQVEKTQTSQKELPLLKVEEEIKKENLVFDENKHVDAQSVKEIKQNTSNTSPKHVEQPSKLSGAPDTYTTIVEKIVNVDGKLVRRKVKQVRRRRDPGASTDKSAGASEPVTTLNAAPPKAPVLGANAFASAGQTPTTAATTEVNPKFQSKEKLPGTTTVIVEQIVEVDGKQVRRKIRKVRRKRDPTAAPATALPHSS